MAVLLSRVKEKFQAVFDMSAAVAHKMGLNPNAMSILGFLFAVFSAILYYYRLLQLAAIFLLISGFCDALDGTIAKTYGQMTKFGAFLDSTLDRLAEAIVFSSLILANPPLSDPVWGLAALVTAILVSYTRARGESIGVAMASVGIAERAERILALAIATFLNYVWLGVILVAMLSTITIIQRITHVYRKT